MEPIMEMLKNRPVQIPGASVVVIPIGESVSEVLRTAAMLRASGIRTSIDTSRRKLKKSLAAASSKGIRYVILIGENEERIGKIRLKDMIQKTELVLTIQEAISILSDHVPNLGLSATIPEEVKGNTYKEWSEDWK
ncbi:His/Gly/Thr/Pro-type tRNA ligase C-terminal domain-containing protein [Paenibacillus caui]|uniref:His/Gly/Thr/Pro-type tRNA ligase C-terminal domain-containing protein n=1 Tax=Paenibacillus caui TaxID=2873927 RepID=UPI001F3FE07F|nr:His/Gly/Thr/Pro-type tRNA ligase C-terminal domain-containing protein [Paenibacillus caui]